MKIQFNTGRAYTNEGQVIVCEVDPDACEVAAVTFYDTSRGIAGVVQVVVPLTSPQALARAVMVEYDHCRYDYAPIGTPKFDASLPVIRI